jgi:hypothetical protein
LSAVCPAWVAGLKVAPSPQLWIELLPLECEHFITQKNERVWTGTCAHDMTVVMVIPRWNEIDDITAAKDAVVNKAHFSTAVCMTNRVPLLMRLCTGTGAIATQQWWE